MIDGDNNYMKKFRHILEYILAYLLFKFLKLMPIYVASNFCGFIFKHLMYFVFIFTGENKKGFKHLGFAFPNSTLKERKVILKSSYENIGRFIGEYVNQYKMTPEWFKKNVEVINEDYLIENAKNGFFGITGHFGNWEVMQRFLTIHNIYINVVYTPLKNPYINKIYLKQRSIPQLPKSTKTVKDIIDLIKKRQPVGILIDQRDKVGEFFKFFEEDAKTSTAIQKLAFKYKYNMVPVSSERRKDNKNKFIITAFKTLNTNKESEEDAVQDLTEQSLQVIQSWIEKKPENWLLWTYSRWRKTFK